MKKLQRLWLNIKIRSIWRMQFLMILLKDHFQKKYFSYDEKIMEGRPLVYSCSGCSSAAQMANYLALQLDTGRGLRKCLVLQGGNVKKIVRTALSGRKIVAIDGCPLACTKACLHNHNITPGIHFELTGFVVSKRRHEDFAMVQANQLLEIIKHKIMLDDRKECLMVYNEEIK